MTDKTTPDDEDFALEQEIAYCREQAEGLMESADQLTRDAPLMRITAREYFAQMAALIAQRSPAQIERMEREKGLR